MAQRMLSDRVHGSLDYGELARLGLRPGDVIDFSANTFADGLPQRIAEALASTNVTHYPDREMEPARSELAACLGVGPRELAIGAGACSLLWRLVAMTPAGSTVGVVGPTFSEFRTAAIAHGRRVDEFCSDLGAPFALKVDDLVAWAGARERAAVYVCSPNNPTGTVLVPSDLQRIAAAVSPGILVVDEAYATPFAAPRPKRANDIVSLRSLTKILGCPGIRVGYLVAGADLCARLEQSRPTWSVGAHALTIVSTCCALVPELQERERRLKQAASALAEQLRERGVPCHQPGTPWLLARVGDGDTVRACLLERHRLLVRACASFGLAEWIRISPRLSPALDQRLISALLECVQTDA